MTDSGQASHYDTQLKPNCQLAQSVLNVSQKLSVMQKYLNKKFLHIKSCKFRTARHMDSI